jgi:hypothetical protein
VNSPRRSRLRTPNARAAASTPVRDNVVAMAGAWRAQWAEVSKRRALLPDALAGLTIAAVALPLNVALAVACGLPPIAGLVAGAVGGAIAAARRSRSRAPPRRSRSWCSR